MGNIAEWYDFGIYSYLAAVALNHVFFPDAGDWSSVFTLGTFAAAFLARPFGGVILGPLGDRIGRTKVLSATVIAPTAAQSDALSTAFYVGGIEVAEAYCQRHREISVLLVLPGAKSGTTEQAPVNLSPGQWRSR